MDDIAPPPAPDDELLLALEDDELLLALEDDDAPPALDEDDAPPALDDEDDAPPAPEEDDPSPEEDEELAPSDVLVPVSPPPQPETAASKSGSTHVDGSEGPHVVTNRFMIIYPVEVSARCSQPPRLGRERPGSRQREGSEALVKQRSR